MRTPERTAKVAQVLSRRQPDLRVVLENIANAHNANAVLRTCDAAGVLHVDVISGAEDPLPINSAITTRADKWLEIHPHVTPEECLVQLKSDGFQIAAAHLGEGAVPYTSLDYVPPTAIVFGNEKNGLTAEALALADVRIKIPMFGMAQSLNLSVSAGIILYEAVRQRIGRGVFDAARLSPAELERMLEDWLEK